MGNQLFCYAAARRLALVNQAELVLDDVTGFARDHVYKRRYALQGFSIPGRTATPAERLEPFERPRRALVKALARLRPFEQRRYSEPQGIDFDPRLLDARVADIVRLDGLWQSESYFKDVEPVIREDLRIKPPTDELNIGMADRVGSSNAVAVHVRWFDQPGEGSAHNLATDYYVRAIRHMEQTVADAHYFLFSDDPSAAMAALAFPEGRVTPVTHNRGDASAVADLWLMSLCRHFITANSTFSWWGAWLAPTLDKVVVTPGLENRNGQTAWGFEGLIPTGWLKL